MKWLWQSLYFLISLLKQLQKLFALLHRCCELLSGFVSHSLVTKVLAHSDKQTWVLLLKYPETRHILLAFRLKSHIHVWDKVSWKILSQVLYFPTHTSRRSRFLISWTWTEVFTKNNKKVRVAFRLEVEKVWLIVPVAIFPIPMELKENRRGKRIERYKKAKNLQPPRQDPGLSQTCHILGYF